MSYQHNKLVNPQASKFSSDVNNTAGRTTTSYASLRVLDPKNDVVFYNGVRGQPWDLFNANHCDQHQ